LEKIAPQMPGTFASFAGVFEGGFGKSGVLTWFFGGEFVVNLWWNVVGNRLLAGG
jgi:hypothetical protein